ncbi:MAG: hypothetical protein QOJ65_1203, partial [Fimbriimonadaceae bacterium]|nr:hypothetical protein [Fimbriimonadaceae bacterium]
MRLPFFDERGDLEKCNWGRWVTKHYGCKVLFRRLGIDRVQRTMPK